MEVNVKVKVKKVQARSHRVAQSTVQQCGTERDTRYEYLIPRLSRGV